MISVLIADPDEEFAREIGWALSSSPEIKFHTIATDFTQLETVIKAHAVNIVLLGPSWKSQSLYNLLALPLKQFPWVSILCSSQSREDTISPEELLTPGIESKRIKTIDFPASSQEIVGAIREICASAGNLEAEVRQETSNDNQPQQVKEKHTDDSKGKLITVFSTKGGVGKTVIATNLAVCLAQRFRSQVLILDLDFQFGDVGVTLKLQPKNTIYDAVLMADTLDSNTLSNFLTLNGTGVKALLAPLEPEVADLISGAHTEKIIKVAKSIARYVIIDTPPSFDDNVLVALQQSDLIYLVSTMDVASVKNIKLCLQTLHLLGYPREKSELIINRMYRKSGLELDEIEKALETKALLAIPQDKLVPFSLNKGIPVVLNAPRTPFSRSIYQLSRLLEETDTTKQPRKEEVEKTGEREMSKT